MLQPIKKLLANKPLLSTLILLASTVLLLYPGDQTPDDMPSIPFLDKIVHIIIFGSCAFSLYFDYITKKSLAQPMRKVLWFTLALLLFGALVEVLQGKYLHRTASIDDFLADLVGVVLGFAFAHFASQRIYDWVVKS